MSAHDGIPISFGQIEADLYMAESAMKRASALTSKAGKFY